MPLLVFARIKRILAKLLGLEESFIDRIVRGDVEYIMNIGVPKIEPPSLPEVKPYGSLSWLAEGFEVGSILLVDPEALMYILVSSEAAPALPVLEARGDGFSVLSRVADMSRGVEDPVYAVAATDLGEVRVLAAEGYVTGLALERRGEVIHGYKALDVIGGERIEASFYPLRVRRALVEWSDDKLSVYVRGLDNQHKYLVNTLNMLFNGVVTGRGRKALEDVLRRMIEYTKFHFKSEEILMEKYDYPTDKLERHAREHRSFVEATTKFKEDYEAGKRELGLDVFKFLAHWLENHIAGTDRDYGLYFKRIGVANYEPAASTA